jgi:uracil-DNA glycosylase
MTKLVILTEHITNGDDAEGEILSDGNGRMIKGICERQGIDIADSVVLPVIREAGSSIFKFVGPQSQGIPQSKPVMNGKYLLSEYGSDLEWLQEELLRLKPNLILGLGQITLWLLTHERSLRKYRGSPINTKYGKFIATYSPRSVMGDFRLRPVIEADFHKAKKEMEFAGVQRPARELWIDPTLEDLEAVDERIMSCDMLSIDIETKTPQITHVGFATSPEWAIVVPFFTRAKPSRNYWPTLRDEVKAWEYVRRWCKNGKKIVGQNFNYDMAYLWKEYGIELPNATEDTMLLQHALQPEMEKGLGFLGSLYSSEPQWKFMRANKDTTKKED